VIFVKRIPPPQPDLKRGEGQPNHLRNLQRETGSTHLLGIKPEGETHEVVEKISNPLGRKGGRGLLQRKGDMSSWVSPTGKR